MLSNAGKTATENHEVQLLPVMHLSVVTKTGVAQVLTMLTQCIWEYLLMKVLACTCYMHITVQCTVNAHHKQLRTF